jgi:hypothetical protein
MQGLIIFKKYSSSANKALKALHSKETLNPLLPP